MSRPRKLSEQQVRLVRDNYRRRLTTRSNRQMARELGVTDRVICTICKGTGYKTVARDAI